MIYAAVRKKYTHITEVDILQANYNYRKLEEKKIGFENVL